MCCRTFYTLVVFGLFIGSWHSFPSSLNDLIYSQFTILFIHQHCKFESSTWKKSAVDFGWNFLQEIANYTSCEKFPFTRSQTVEQKSSRVFNPVYSAWLFEFFQNNTNLTYLYKVNIEGFLKFQILVTVVSSFPTTGNFIYFAETFQKPRCQPCPKCQKCQICVIKKKLDW